MLPGIPDGRDEPGVGLFELAPQRDVVFGGIDILPIHQTVDSFIVELGVEQRSPRILDGILDGGDDDDDDQGHCTETWI